MEAVIAAFIAAAASIACQLIIARSGAKENKKSQEATERLIIYLSLIHISEPTRP